VGIYNYRINDWLFGEFSNSRGNKSVSFSIIKEIGGADVKDTAIILGLR
jgi:hypothetical protein